MKKRVGKVFVASVLACTMIVTPVFATPSINDLKESKKEAQQQVESLQDELARLIGKIDQLESDLIDKGAEVEQANKDLEKAKKEEEKQYEDMKKRIVYMYEQGDSDIAKILEAQSITEVLNTAEYAQELHTYDRNKLEEYVQTKEEVANLKDKLEKELKDMEGMQKEFEAEKDNLHATIKEKKAEVENFDEQLQAAIEEANRKAEEEARRKELAAQQAQANQQRPSGGNSNHGGSSSNSSSNNGNSSSGNNSKPVTPPSGVSGGAVVAYAKQFVGNPYVWGGTSLTNGTDCSGFTQGVYRAFGIYIPRTSGAQRSAGRGVSYSEAQPGDLICYSGHVAIYIGGGAIVHASNSAPYPKGGIKISPNAAYRPIVAVRRLI